MTEGHIYCFSNPSMPGLLKIGVTTRTPEERAKELFTTGVASPFRAEFSLRVKFVFETEKQIHLILNSCRVPSREFFATSVTNAFKILSTYALKNCVIADSLNEHQPKADEPINVFKVEDAFLLDFATNKLDDKIENETVRACVVYDAYKEYCVAKSVKPKSVIMFSRALTKHVSSGSLVSKKTMIGIVYTIDYKRVISMLA